MEDRFPLFRGAMVGLAVGDALGAPLEGLKAGRIQQLYGTVEDYIDPATAWKDKPRRWRMPGLYTDDTQQALVLADTLVRCHGFDAGFFAKRLVEMAEPFEGEDFGAFRGTGRNFRESVRRLKEGRVKPLEAGSVSAGIGASMRVAPVGLYFCDEKEAMAKAAIEQGLVTNRDPRSLEAALGVAFCVAEGAGGKWSGARPKDRAEGLIEFIDWAADLIQQEYLPWLPLETWDHCGRVKAAVRNFRYYLDIELDSVWKQIVAEANRAFPDHNISAPSQSFALAGPVCAMFLGVSSRNYPEGIIRAVNLGKDTDSVAAITGAILGARLGIDNIPESWQKRLENLEQVRLRGDALLQSSFQGIAIQDIVKMEVRLTRTEIEARLKITDKPAAVKKKNEGKAHKRAADRKKPEQGEEPTKEELLARRKKLKKPAKVKAPWRGGKV